MVEEELRNRYLHLLGESLAGILIEDDPVDFWSGGTFDLETRRRGGDWPGKALTMIGTRRILNLRYVCEYAIKNNISGDFIETGVWRGGACIYMRGILAAYGDTTRKVWVADSFKGLPPPDPINFPHDKNDPHHTFPALAVPRAEVEENFRRYNLLDNQVQFLEGLFKDTLPSAPFETLSVLRLDGDMYESTIESLEYCYHKLTNGGHIIIDDYNLSPCKAAVTDFRNRHNITNQIYRIDGNGVYWQAG
jgi:hypothetical protein